MHEHGVVAMGADPCVAEHVPVCSKAAENDDLALFAACYTASAPAVLPVMHRCWTVVAVLTVLETALETSPW